MTPGHEHAPFTGMAAPIRLSAAARIKCITSVCVTMWNVNQGDVVTEMNQEDARAAGAQSPAQTAGPESAEAPGEDSRIVNAVIYPSIGVARLGNAPEGYVVGPEVTHPVPKMASTDPGRNPYRDSDGRLYPQAARFRIYGCNAKGEIVRELSAPGDDAEITWTVHLANKKSAWYAFQ